MTIPRSGFRTGKLVLTPRQRRRFAVALERHLGRVSNMLVLADSRLGASGDDAIATWRATAAGLDGPELADLRDLSGLLGSGSEAKPSDRGEPTP